MFLFAFLLALIPASCGGSSASTPSQPPAPTIGTAVSVYMTTADGSKLLAQQTGTNFTSASATGTTITVDDTVRYQQMDGFGASLTDSSTWLIANKLTDAQRTKLMQDLFSPTNGIGLSFLRQPMGATDFTAVGNYSYDDMPAGQTDPTLANFSIAHDLTYTIPVLKQAIAVNPNIKVMATPWSPPAWMKDGGTMNGGSVPFANYGALANYFVKFVQAYQAQGVPIYAIGIQNEPLYSTTGYPSMYMDAVSQARFIGTSLGPAMQNAGLSSVKLIAYEHNWDHPEYPQTVLTNAPAAQYLAGAAFHCYAGDESAQTTLHNAVPTKDIWFTECSGTVGSNFGGDLKWNAQHLLIGTTRNWAKGVSIWNMALDEHSGPKNGGCNDCRGVVTIDTSVSPAKVTFNVEYYSLGHLAKFVTPGAYRIDSNTLPGTLEDVAFVNPDGSTALLVLNSSNSTQTFSVKSKGMSFSYTLPSGALATFQWK